ncbi:TIGR01777 family oxidoreductase [Chromatiaceae bacterium AAb-1]|nr:TIGR01777 family oxidoreductase [Chromatiaceae bacterium AAb-1]
MNILISGGTGLIGQALIKYWAAQHHITVLTRSSEKARRILPADITLIEHPDQQDFNALDAVINLAGEPIADKRWTEKQKQLICHSRWQLTGQLSQHIQQAGTPPHTFISGSAIGYYGRQNEQFIDEHYTACYPEFTHQVCKKWEELAQQAASETTRVCILRSGVVLSADGGALSKMLPSFKIGLGGYAGSGQQYMSWIHLHDMVRIIDFLLLHPTLSGVFNATAPEPVTNKVFGQLLAKRLQRPAFLPAPASLLKMVLGEMADMLLYGQRVIPRRLQEAGFSFNYPTLQPALASLSL